MPVPAFHGACTRRRTARDASAPGLRPRRRTVRRAPAARTVPSRKGRPSPWTFYARWEWRRATHL